MSPSRRSKVSRLARNDEPCGIAPPGCESVEPSLEDAYLVLMRLGSLPDALLAQQNGFPARDRVDEGPGGELEPVAIGTER